MSEPTPGPGPATDLIAWDPGRPHPIGEALCAELSRQYGRPSKVGGYLSWPLNGLQGFEARVYLHCPTDDCDLWIADPRAGPHIRLVANVVSPEHVSLAVARVREYARGHKQADGQADGTRTATRRLGTPSRALHR